MFISNLNSHTQECSEKLAIDELRYCLNIGITEHAFRWPGKHSSCCTWVTIF